MKKTFVLILVFVMLFVLLCGCENVKTDILPTESQPVTDAKQESYTATDTAYNNLPESLSNQLACQMDEAYAADSQLPEYASTAGQCKLWDKYTEKWQQIADEYYNKIMAYEGISPPSDFFYSSEDLHTFVAAMKTNWEEYSRQQYDQYGKTLQTIYQGGSIIGPLMASYQCEMQKQWALELVGIYQQLPME